MKSFLNRYKNSLLALLALGICVLISLPDPPSALTRGSMIYLGALTGMILLLVTQAIPDYVAVLASLGYICLFGKVGSDTAFLSFSQRTVSMLLLVFAICSTFTQTTLPQRFIAFGFRIFPKTYHSMVVFLTAVGTILNPLMPSTNVKIPLLMSCAGTLAEEAGYKKGSKASVGLFTAAFFPSVITANAFLSSVLVLFALGFTEETQSYTFFSFLGVTWCWLLGVTVLTVAAIFLFCTPKKGESKGDITLKTDFPKMTRSEWITLVVLLLTLFGWMTQSLHGVPPVLVALIAMVVLAAAGVFQPRDLSTRIPWRLLIFIGGLLNVAALMSEYGVDKWLSDILRPVVTLFSGNLVLYIAFVAVLTYVLRLLVFAQGAAFSIAYLALAPTASLVGVSGVVLMLVILGATCVWTLPGSSAAFLSAMGTGGSTLVRHRDTLPMNFLFMLIHILACFISIPVWQAFGLIG
ncbi:MAG: anion permease [Clostridia bacterium]|nr:anion permease [Clostridia bacterium]